jgi:Predicted acetyltransferase
MSAQIQPQIEFRWLDGEAARVLDPDGIEWPGDTRVLYVFENGQLIARSSIMSVPMIEGTWIKPEHRNGTLAVRIIKEVERHYLENGEEAAMAFAPADQPEVAEYLKRLGYEEKPLRFFIKPLVSRAIAA